MVLFGGLILVLTGFAVLAVDIGRIFIVRSELQNVADAAALAGANCLTRNSSSVSPSDCLSTMSSTLNWDRAEDRAQAQLSQNQADNRAISSSGAGHVIDVGYWDLLNKRPSGGTLTSRLSTTLSPISPYDKPAIRVKVSKSDGQNGGPILMLTRLMYGGSDVPMSATAVATISSPSGVADGQLTPIAIDKCILDKYWDSAKASPKLATANTLKIEGADKKYDDVKQTKGQPWVIRIFKNKSDDDDYCERSEWTSFLSSKTTNKDIEPLFTSKNPTPLHIDDAINLARQDLDSLYGKFSTGIVTIPVLTSLNNSSQKIYAFASFRITVNGGVDGKYIEGSFVQSNTSSSSSGIGPFYGTYTPPRLAY